MLRFPSPGRASNNPKCSANSTKTSRAESSRLPLTGRRRNATLTLLDRGGHFWMQEAPAEWNAAVLDFWQ